MSNSSCSGMVVWRAVATGLLGAALVTGAHADADSARNAGAAWLIKQQLGDGSWATASGELGVQATASALMALRNAGQSKSPSYASGATWLSNADADSVDAIARKVEALSYAGHATVAQTEATRLFGMQAISATAVWGGYGAINTADYVDTALALTAVRLGDAAFASKAYSATPGGNPLVNAMCNLVGNRINVASGKQAWPMSTVATSQSLGQGRPSVTATALLAGELRALQRFSAFSAASLTCSTGTYTLIDLLTPALAWLLDQQNADGGFGEQRTDGSKGASNVFVSALVLKALSVQATVAQPQTDNTRAWLLSKQNNTTGSWGGDPLVTATVVSALPAAAGLQLADADRDGLTDNVETQLGSNNSVVDARTQIGSPTLAVSGSTIASFTAKALVGTAFTYALGGSGSYALASGTLPPGLNVNASSGLISGTPTQAGSYSFEYQTSSGGDTVIGRIDVATQISAADSGDAPLPGWALLALGTSLLGAITRRRPDAV
jgi:hypothetical protein